MKLGHADLHIHTDYSDGLASVEEIIAYTRNNTHLDIIAITDHDEVRGALHAMDVAQRYPAPTVKVLMGTEVTLALGHHLLAYFPLPPYPTKPLPRWRSLTYMVEMIHDLGGLTVLAHPMVPILAPLRRRWLSDPHRWSQGVIDGIEVINGTPLLHRYSDSVRVLNQQYVHVGETGGSDAHHLKRIGTAYTLYPGEDIAALVTAITTRKSRAAYGPHIPIPSREKYQQMILGTFISTLKRFRHCSEID
jgi:predicted metal-dependent phosphoesterase TrpH